MGSKQVQREFKVEIGRVGGIRNPEERNDRETGNQPQRSGSVRFSLGGGNFRGTRW